MRHQNPISKLGVLVVALFLGLVASCGNPPTNPDDGSCNPACKTGTHCQTKVCVVDDVMPTGCNPACEAKCKVSPLMPPAMGCMPLPDADADLKSDLPNEWVFRNGSATVDQVPDPTLFKVTIEATFTGLPDAEFICTSNHCFQCPDDGHCYRIDLETHPSKPGMGLVKMIIQQIARDNPMGSPLKEVTSAIRADAI